MQGGETMMSIASQYVSVDVSKAMLDIPVLSFAQGAMQGANRVANTVAGLTPLESA
jgi:hypothetical protein